LFEWWRNFIFDDFNAGFAADNFVTTFDAADAASV
jgi:hypothetical protein